MATTFDTLNEAQKAVLAALADVGGWACSAQLSRRKASLASASSLARKGVIEERDAETHAGFTYKEWRLAPLGSQHSADVERFRAALERISDAWSYAVQSDLENGVAFLNRAAADKFRESYPAISAMGGIINDEYTNCVEPR